MENNAMILGRFADLIEVLDAKKIITVFELLEDGGQRIVYHNKPVYSLYPLKEDNCDDKHGYYKVVGMNLNGLSTTILIKKGE